MATKTGYRPNSTTNHGGNGNGNGDSLGVDKHHSDDSFFIIVIVILLAVILFFMPVLMWMYTDIRQTEIKVQKLIKKLDEK